MNFQTLSQRLRSSFLDDAIGDHYWLYDCGSVYLLAYRIIGQRAAFDPGFVAAEGAFPLPRDIGELIVSRVRSHPESEDKLPPPEKPKLKPILEDLGKGLDKLHSSGWVDETYRADLVNDMTELKLCLNVGAYRGCLAMAGRILEAVLKISLKRASHRVEKDWMVGKLLQELDAAGVYVGLPTAIQDADPFKG